VNSTTGYVVDSGGRIFKTTNAGANWFQQTSSTGANFLCVNFFDEIKRLLDSGVSPERLDSLGLEYRYGLHYIEGKLKGSEFIETLSVKTWQFAKRQMTWWKKDSRINWFNPISDKQKILQLVQVFSMLK
jgi:tRNA A37 N6-isopentenylltransferase MiaA